MDPLEALAIFVAGIAAGTINTIVGSGTLITFPVLIALGYQPLVANVSNNIGLVPGSMTGAYGYRRELAGQRERVIQLGAFSIAGAVIGATLLLVLPSSAFDAIVPALIAIALVLVVVQPRLNASSLNRRHREGHRKGGVRGLVAACGVYGGYFGAAQGILLMGILGLAIDDDPAAPERPQERAGRAQQPDRRADLRVRGLGQLGRGRADRGRLDHRRRHRGALRAAALARRRCGC